jgi:hypothetical protein
MTEQGFEYIPYVEPPSSSGFAEPGTEEEFVDLYGFGIATFLLEDEQLDAAEFEEESASDPNSVIDAVSADSAPAGCLDSAYDDVYNSDTSEVFYEVFGAAIDDFFTDADSDLRILDLEAEWSTCMAEKGYDFAHENDAKASVLRRLADIGAISDLEIDGDGNVAGYSGGGIEAGCSLEAAVKEIAVDEIVIAQDSLSCSATRKRSSKRYIGKRSNAS